MYKCTPLHYASKYGYVDIVDKLLKCEGIDMNAMDENNMTAVDHALNIETYKVFERKGLLQREDSGYGRTVFRDSHLRHNDRTSQVQKLLGNVKRVEDMLKEKNKSPEAVIENIERQ